MEKKPKQNLKKIPCFSHEKPVSSMQHSSAFGGTVTFTLCITMGFEVAKVFKLNIAIHPVAFSGFLCVVGFFHLFYLC